VFLPDWLHSGRIQRFLADSATGVSANAQTDILQSPYEEDDRRYNANWNDDRWGGEPGLEVAERPETASEQTAERSEYLAKLLHALETCRNLNLRVIDGSYVGGVEPEAYADAKANHPGDVRKWHDAYEASFYDTYLAEAVGKAVKNGGKALVFLPYEHLLPSATIDNNGAMTALPMKTFRIDLFPDAASCSEHLKTLKAEQAEFPALGIFADRIFISLGGSLNGKVYDIQQTKVPRALPVGATPAPRSPGS
jgi:hypothetical protein